MTGDPKRASEGGDDSYGGRAPTSHERLAGRPWNASYTDGTAPWDIGRPQPAVARLAEQGEFAGAVLDAGCGTGENALHVASLGLPVLGFDVAETAISIARGKAEARGLDAEFVAADALQLTGQLGRSFDTVLDCGLFHTFDSDERRAYAASLASAVHPGGTLHVLCFRDDEAEHNGPHPLSEQELRTALESGGEWRLVCLNPERLLMNLEPYDAPAWLAKVTRVRPGH